jgi:hypothetical protein
VSVNEMLGELIREKLLGSGVVEGLEADEVDWERVAADVAWSLRSIGTFRVSPRQLRRRLEKASASA